MQYNSSSDISLEVLNIIVALLLHAEHISFYFRVFITLSSLSVTYQSFNVYAAFLPVSIANAAQVLLIGLVQEM